MLLDVEKRVGGQEVFLLCGTHAKYLKDGSVINVFGNLNVFTISGPFQKCENSADLICETCGV